ncbi:uncharacterized protein K452DRAFT_284225 [Aplosporella prunicola CBS 121167]|uniref:Uncharacterized protein n=1 Tax=Aplosporella prunicola CBS 121167 TaxID=1176127 RepID=A0A6A6BQ24_9PEZI|nr:uncharacterized protein K452DRAFT_284225 [Aplosporella prunicola CBS 121167]KAF2145848.1 hypothetical protein K452DRAFT_284225 [Aplosporella prunicola CBS 121167]
MSSPRNPPTKTDVLQLSQTGPLEAALAARSACTDPPTLRQMAHCAAPAGQAPILQHCLSHGVQIDYLILSRALSSHSKPTLQALFSAGLDPNAHVQAHLGSVIDTAITLNLPNDIIAYLLQQGADPRSARERGGMPNLTTAACTGNATLLRLLLKHGEMVGGSRALHLAARAGELEVARVLLEEGGADVNEVAFAAEEARPRWWRSGDDEAGAPLHFSAAAGKTDVVVYLLKKGADVGTRDLKGRIARERAEESGYPEVGAALCGL